MIIYNNNNNISAKIYVKNITDDISMTWNWHGDTPSENNTRPSLPLLRYSTSMNQFFSRAPCEIRQRDVRAYPDIGIFAGCPVPTTGTTMKVR